MKICKVFVDRIPENCGQCVLMGYINDEHPVCYGIANPVIREIVGNPYDMKYRRSDCPLAKNKGNLCDDVQRFEKAEEQRKEDK